MIERIASNLGRNDEGPNVELAEELARTRDAKGISEIVRGLDDGKEGVANDCIKVLYEIGYRDCTLIEKYAERFVALLDSKNNRLVWGAAIALSLVAEARSEYLLGVFDRIRAAYERGSVITVDNCVSVFAGIAKAGGKCERIAFPVIVEHLAACRPKEVAQHAERAAICVNAKNAAEFRSALAKRYPILSDAQKKRVDKLLRSLP